MNLIFPNWFFRNQVQINRGWADWTPGSWLSNKCTLGLCIAIIEIAHIRTYKYTMTLDRCYLLGSFSCYYRQKRNAEKKATSKCIVVFLWKYILLVEFALTSQNYSKDSSYKIFWVQKITIPLETKNRSPGIPCMYLFCPCIWRPCWTRCSLESLL